MQIANSPRPWLANEVAQLRGASHEPQRSSGA